MGEGAVLEPAGAYLEHFLGLDVGQDEDLGMKRAPNSTLGSGKKPTRSILALEVESEICPGATGWKCVFVWVSRSVVSSFFNPTDCSCARLTSLWNSPKRLKNHIRSHRLERYRVFI